MKNITLLTALCLPTVDRVHPSMLPAPLATVAYDLALAICALTRDDPDDKVFQPPPQYDAHP